MFVSIVILTSAPGDLQKGLTQAATTTEQAVRETLANLPLAFEANKGQTDRRVDFLARGPGYLAFLTPTEAVLKLGTPGEAGSPPAALRMKLINANPASSPSASDKTGQKTNYFLGNSSARVQGVPSYAKVGYRGVYPGIDMAYYGNPRQLEYDFIVSPGADPGAIKLNFDGADRLVLRKEGDLEITVAGHRVVQRKPYIYQNIAGSRKTIPGRFALKDKTVAFEVGTYDTSRPLVIDPVLAYRSYLGGGGVDIGFGVFVDQAGAAYVTGSTLSSNFPTAGGVLGCAGAFTTTSLQCDQGIGDAFVTKVNAGGATLAWSTYLGGNREDLGWDVEVDDSGNVYVAGSTESELFPTTPEAFDATCGSDGQCNAPALGVEPLSDSFLAKLGPNGDTLLYSTYLGGSDVDLDTNPAAGALPDMGLAVKGSVAYISAATGSADFPTTADADRQCGTLSSQAGLGCDLKNDAFLSLVDTSKSGAASLPFSTYLGGDGDDQGKGVAVDAAGDAYVAGITFGFATNPLSPGSTVVNNFPALSAVQPVYGGGASDAFVAKFFTSAYLAKASAEVAVSGNNKKVSAGASISSGNDEQSGSVGAMVPRSGTPGVVPGAKEAGASVDAGRLAYATYLGGGGTDEAWDVDVNGMNAYVAGYTDSGDDPATPAPDGTLGYFPTTVGAFDTSFNGRPYAPDGSTAFMAGDAFVTKLNESGTGLVYSTYLGSTSGDVGVGLDVDSSGAAYVTGYTHCETPVVHLGPIISDMQIGFPASGNGTQRIGPATTSTTAPYAVHARATGTNAGAVDAKDLPAGTEVKLTVVPDAISGKAAKFSNDSDSITVTVNANGNAADTVTPVDTSAGVATIRGEIVSSPDGSPYAVGTLATGIAEWGYPEPTCSGDFPTTAGAPQPAIDGSYLGNELHNSPAEGFVTKLDPTGSSLTYSTYLGGNDFDRGYAIAVRELETGNETYVTGRSGSTFTGTPGSAFPNKPASKGNRDAYIAKITEP